MARQKNDYFIYGDMVSVMECSFDKSLKDFYTRLPYIQNIDHRGNQIHLHLEWGSNYYQTVGFDKVEYRDRNGNIVTLLSNMEHHNSYGASQWFGTMGDDWTSDVGEYYTQTELPYNNEYGIWDVEEPYNKAGLVNLYDLVMNKINRENPYFHIHMKGEKGTTQEEKDYWKQQGWRKGNQFVRDKYLSGHKVVHVLDSTGQYAVAYMDDILITFKAPVYKSIQASVDSTNKTYSFLPICETNSMDDYDIKVSNINIDGNGTNKDTFSMEGRKANQATVVPFSNFINGLNRVTFTLYNHNRTIEKTFEFYHYVPTVSALTLTNQSDLGNNLIDNTTNVTWTSTNQANADVYINGVKYTSVGSSKACVIPKGKLKVGDNTIKVVINYSQANITGSITAQAETKIKCTRLLPTVSDIAINSSNIDRDITVSWNSIRQSKYRILTGNNSVIASGTTATSYTIPRGTLNVNTTKLKVEVTYNSGFDSVVATEELPVSLTCDAPIIYSLEPADLQKNVGQIINVTFNTNEFCDRFELTANDMFVSGTNARSISFGANSFNKGTNTLTLKIYYSPIYDSSVVRTASKTVTFFGYSQPNTPVLDNNTIYATSTPVITWSSEEQDEFELEVRDSTGTNVLQEFSGLGNITQCTLNTLENETTYIVNVRIKNIYGLWSYWSSKTISTLFSDIIVPEFDLVTNPNGVLITITGIQDPNYQSISIFRKEGYGDWIEIASDCNVEDSIVDFTSCANMEILYKLRIYDTNNAYKDSDVKAVTFKLSSYTFTDIQRYDNFKSIPAVSINVSMNKNIVSKVYSGASKPRVFIGKTNYKTIDITMSVFTKDFQDVVNFFEHSNDFGVFCVRDVRGNKVFAQVSIVGYTPIGRNIVELQLAATEINFVETKMYQGSGYRRLTYLNGEYFLDGTIDLSGYYY